jgi:hypothetical protein
MNEKEVGRAVEMDRDSQVSRERGSCWQISQKGRSGCLVKVHIEQSHDDNRPLSASKRGDGLRQKRAG